MSNETETYYYWTSDNKTGSVEVVPKYVKDRMIMPKSLYTDAAIAKEMYGKNFPESLQSTYSFGQEAVGLKQPDIKDHSLEIIFVNKKWGAVVSKVKSDIDKIKGKFDFTEWLKGKYNLFSDLWSNKKTKLESLTRNNIQEIYETKIKNKN